MEITAAMVKALRDRTGAGMMECKNALTETGGDMEAATTVLRKRGLAQVAKRAGRTTSEGLIGSYLSEDARVGVLVEVNCESDFVARTDQFQALVRDAAEALARAGDRAEAVLADPQGPIQSRVTAAIAGMGENITVPRFVRFETSGVLGLYIHLGGTIGVLVDVAGATPEVAKTDTFRNTLKELAMHVAAANPQYATRDAIPADVVERERGIYRAQLEGQNKPAQVIDKIIEGKLSAFYEQTVLPDQPSIRDPKVTVGQMLAAVSKELGTTISVTRFARLKVGESA